MKLQPLTSRFSLANCGLEPFAFAGFKFPRFLAHLPRGTMARRLERYKAPSTGPYYHAPAPLQAGDNGRGFYLDSDGMPGLRWAWADKVEGATIRHTGWFTDDYGTDTVRGVVFTLPGGRGFLAGYSMGEGMASSLEYAIYESARDAAYAADSLAENAAEREREYQDSLDDSDE